MFSAFSSIDYHSIRANTPAEMAIKRLTGIGEVLSGIDISAIHTQDDMARALLTLDTADKCIRTISPSSAPSAPRKSSAKPRA